MKKIAEQIQGRLKRWFPDRQIYFRTNGKVHFLHLSPRLQISVAAGMAALGGWMLAATAVMLMQPAEMLIHQSRLSEKQHAIDQMAASNAALANKLKAMQRDFQQLEARQNFLNAIIEKQTGKAPAADVAPARAKSAPKGQVSMAIQPVFTDPVRPRPAVADRVADVRSAQDRLIVAMIAKTERDIDQVSSLVDSTGLSSARFLRFLAGQKPAAAGMGGPMIPLNSETGKYDAAMQAAIARGEHDDFDELLAKNRQLVSLKALLATVPMGSPVLGAYVTSPFGVRADPIEGGAAFHPGVDLQSKASQTIMAPAPGTVTFAGRDGEYGNSVIIDHRNGFQTRYAHMSRLSVRIGDRVTAGAPLGRMGSTGRSTGLHLHYEIWFNGKLQNPARFLKGADHVFDIRQAAVAGQNLGG